MYQFNDLVKLMQDCGPIWYNEVFKEIIDDYVVKEQFMKLIEKYNTKKTIYPPFENMFKQFKQCSLYDISVVIFGYKPNQKPNLTNIINELHDEYKYVINDRNFKINFREDYKSKIKEWNKQGVLTLYYCLSYDNTDSKFHIELWRLFMNKVVKMIQLKQKYIIFLLWENGLGEIPIILREELKDDSKRLKTKNDKDKRKEELTYYLLQRDAIQVKNSRFIGCNHFIITNHYLKEWFRPTIQWV